MALESLEQRLALASYSFMDQDRTVTVTTSKGTGDQLAQSIHITTFGVLFPKRHLDSITLTNPIFSGTDLTVTARDWGGARVPVDIGIISCNFPLGNVTVDGDIMSVSANTAGPADFAGTAAGTVRVGSIGVKTPPGTSTIRGRLTSLDVAANVNAAQILANSIGTVYIGGNLQGGPEIFNGSIQANSGSITSVNIAGDLVGSTGNASGWISALGTIGSVRIGGAIYGGVGSNSGVIEGGGLGTVWVGKYLAGGQGDSSGVIRGNTNGINAIYVTNSIIGGSGMDSGAVGSWGTLGALSIGGNLSGGGGQSSGSVWCLGTIESVSIGGNISAGNGPGSAAIGATDVLKSLVVTGSVMGTTRVPVIIAACGTNQSKVVLPSITIGGSLTRALVLAGYAVTANGPAPANGKARIGNVSVGSLVESSIVAGADSSSPPHPFSPWSYGSSDVGIDAHKTSRIDSITILTAALGSGNAAESFGLVAGSFGKITIAGVRQTLPGGGRSKTIGNAVGGVSNLHIHRL